MQGVKSNFSNPQELINFAAYYNVVLHYYLFFVFA